MRTVSRCSPNVRAVSGIPIPSTITPGEPADIRPLCKSIASTMGSATTLWMMAGGTVFSRRSSAIFGPRGQLYLCRLHPNGRHRTYRKTDAEKLQVVQEAHYQRLLPEFGKTLVSMKWKSRLHSAYIWQSGTRYHGVVLVGTGRVYGISNSNLEMCLLIMTTNLGFNE